MKSEERETKAIVNLVGVMFDRDVEKYLKWYDSLSEAGQKEARKRFTERLEECYKALPEQPVKSSEILAKLAEKRTED